MREEECLAKMKAPGDRRPNASGAFRGGVCQILVGRACDLACPHCTQASNLRGKTSWMTPENFERAVDSLKGYYGVIGTFGGSPCLSKHFGAYCEILKAKVPFRQRGLWANHPHGNGKLCRETFNPKCSNLNVHKSQEAYREFVNDWPECRPVGLTGDSHHSPVHASMTELGVPEDKRWELIASCDINQKWSAMIAEHHDDVRGWFCEVAAAQAMLLNINSGIPVFPDWWKRPMEVFSDQVREHCHHCAVPLRGKGILSCDKDSIETTTPRYAAVYHPKGSRAVLVTESLESIQPEAVTLMTDYLGNAG